ncbi:related to HOS3-Trichostatin A-insensitive homodimeric histone deacetylase (HDAC) [Sporisorium reilianum f. sp. reilianum]|uniref:Related to HOS3-Trichostatin A-insensitive homodimeric histone deacetylase (HDAC) n=1 Tax=Sporisorium reilianum f. sp. reilianum TaxID=72559 RepID=A0A2N8UJX7_9BASI|nr:related to HOS3-Trichostatin A-insensitive homodimeric histone deacetylase (HDAC) [Sporisorium reilianum f. sp. reilianum]
MVFIVKIPNRSRANTPEASNTPSTEHPPSQPASTMDAQTPTSAAMPAMPAELDVLLAPSVLNHRYVRGVDKSLIVERPERIRAVLLGIATAIGKSASDQHPPLPSHTVQPSPTSTSKAALLHSSDADAPSLSLTQSRDAATVDSAPTPSLPAAPTQNKDDDDDDDLVARLNSLSMQANSAPQSTAPTRQKFRVLHSTRSLPLDPPHPAVAFTHAHADEKVTQLESAYGQAKKKRRDAQRPTSPPTSASTPVPNPVPHAADADRAEREATPTPASVMPELLHPPQQQQPEAPAASTSHAAYLEYLCSRAPDHPPLSHHKGHQSSPSKTLPEDSEAYTSSDGEGDDAMHLSEVPEHLPQGDLYLAGPTDSTNMDGGSAEAIRHAMGACCEAVDRVTLAAAVSTSSASTTTLPLREIKYESSSQEGMQGEATPPPAKRAFVLSRPPGHHCSGSTPQGFCWVNNAIVAAAHGYLQHGIDRVVIFDIDLHHGNGTQNLAWRINADANKHDDQRSERIASLRAAALERARQALGSGHGRAHASRIAKVALTEQDELDVKKQAGPRALRLFYSSLHDIESFPCEDGDANMIKDASTCVEGAHGQWIWNVHLDHYRTESDFKRLYDDKYRILFAKAARFLAATAATPQNTLVLISAGFDACAYEYPGMQRHGKHVPASFYHTFARDAVHFADAHAQGKLVSVLEGGYSDRALCSAALAHVTGLASGGDAEAEAEYWKLENLIAVEKVAKKMAAHAAATVAEVGNVTPKRRQAELAPWLALTSRAFAAFEQACGKPHVVALGASAMPMRGAARSSATMSTSALSSPATGAGGRVLRDRALKTRPGAFDSATSTPQPRRAGSPTKATPTRAAAATAKNSPSKKTSPSKASVAAGPFGAPAMPETPVKVEGVETMAMDTETPTRVAGAGVMRISSIVHAQQAGDGDAVQSDVQQQPQPSVESTSQAGRDTAADAMQTSTAVPPSIGTSVAATAPPVPHPIPSTATTATTATSSSSDPTFTLASPNTSQPVTQSAPHERVIATNIPNLREEPALDYANAGEDEDAPGSPDITMESSNAEEGEREMPGGLGAALAGLRLVGSGSASGGLDGGRVQEGEKREKGERKEGASLYPHLPVQFGSQSFGQQ